jgi:hypothetical protein
VLALEPNGEDTPGNPFLRFQVQQSSGSHRMERTAGALSAGELEASVGG